MLKLACRCGLVLIETEKRPDFIHACDCTFRREIGARPGYHHPSKVSVDGSTTHFTPTASAVFGDSLMGVNMRLVDESEPAGIERRYPDGQAWSGEGGLRYVREPRVIGAPEAAG